MHHVSFHHEFEHDPVDPDEECTAGGCPSAAINPRPGRRPETVLALRTANAWFAERGFDVTPSQVDYAEQVKASTGDAASGDLHSWVDLCAERADLGRSLPLGSAGQRRVTAVGGVAPGSTATVETGRWTRRGCTACSWCAAPTACQCAAGPRSPTSCRTAIGVLGGRRRNLERDPRPGDPKRAAWVRVETLDASGQLILWVSGEAGMTGPRWHAGRSEQPRRPWRCWPTGGIMTYAPVTARDSQATNRGVVDRTARPGGLGQLAHLAGIGWGMELINAEILKEKVIGYLHGGQTQFLDKHRSAHALEDLRPELHDEATALILNHEVPHQSYHLTDAASGAALLSAVPSNAGTAARLFDILENCALDTYGHVEEVPLFHFLSLYPVTTYTYEISKGLARGERPNSEKLKFLKNLGYTATINLCAEMINGDGPNIQLAGLGGQIETAYIPIVDMTQPSCEQVLAFLNYASTERGGPIYAHCEAGMGRTGVMIACYRMAIMGWNYGDALTEAKNFGCSVPMQQAFIEEFANMLRNSDARLVPYPILEFGSVLATRAERGETLASAAIVGQVPD